MDSGWLADVRIENQHSRVLFCFVLFCFVLF